MGFDQRLSKLIQNMNKINETNNQEYLAKNGSDKQKFEISSLLSGLTLDTEIKPNIDAR